MEEQEENVKQVAWNLSQALISEIAGLLSQASTFSVLRKLDKQFDCMHAVKLRIVQHLTEQESKEFTNLEEVITKRIVLDSKEFMDDNISAVNRYKLAKGVIRYNNLVMGALQRYGYLIGEKQETKNINQ